MNTYNTKKKLQENKIKNIMNELYELAPRNPIIQQALLYYHNGGMTRELALGEIAIALIKTNENLKNEINKKLGIK